jgi:hypothetical protein
MVRRMREQAALEDEEDEEEDDEGGAMDERAKANLAANAKLGLGDNASPHPTSAPSGSTPP